MGCFDFQLVVDLGVAAYCRFGEFFNFFFFFPLLTGPRNVT